jgi:hypothetical protein
MAEWRSDSEISDAAEHLCATFVWLKEDELPAAEYPRAQIDAIGRDRDIFLSLDPQKLYDEYERVHAASRAIGTNGEVEADLRESVRHLANWTGLAAEEFKRQMTKMETFCDDQQIRMLQGLLGLAAAYALATRGRDSFLELVKATEAAARKAKDDKEKADTKLKVSVLFSIAGGIVGRDPKSLLSSTLVTMVEIGKDVADRVIEGDDIDQVMENYRREADLLCESFGNGLDHITKSLNAQRASAELPADMVSPLPPICDVRSPDFRYEHFEDTIRDTGPIGPVVEEERRKYVEEKKAEEQRVSEIEKRMNHGGREVE